MQTDAFLKQVLNLQRPAKPVDIGEWFRNFKTEVPSHFSTIERAALGGRRARCVGHAFSAGYQSALEHLFSGHFDAEQPELASFCVSETRGNHPRAIDTALSHEEEHHFLTGSKSFVSGAHEARRLFVACQTGPDTSGRPIIKLVTLSATNPGVHIEALPTLPFIPEVSHGQVRFDRVKLDSKCLLTGDGYTEYVKPFRTCEDLHVMSAVLAYVLGEAMAEALTKTLIEDVLSLLIGFQPLGQADLKSPETHLALAGLRSQMQAVLERFTNEVATANSALHASWRRDVALLKVAGKAHAVRTQKAWSTLRESPNKTS